MINFDCHVHTFFSSDSEENPEKVLQSAVDKGMNGVCFTDHNDYGWPENDDDGKALFLLDFNNYVKYMKDLQHKFELKTKILIGVEQGLSVEYADDINTYDSDRQLDFIIGSSHLVNGRDPYEEEFWQDTDTGVAITAYYESILQNIAVCSNFDVYGHIDYVARYIRDKSFQYNINNYMDIIEEILRQLISKGKGIELNTAGLRYGCGAPNPESCVLRLYRQLGGEIITVGSDAHKSCDVAFYHNQAYRYLSEAGFRYYTVFEGRKPVFYSL